MMSHMTSKLSVNIVYFFANFVLLHSFLRVRQGQCFPIYLPKFFLRSFQKVSKIAHPFSKSSLEDLKFFQRNFPKKFRKSAYFLWKRSLPKIFLRSFENLAPDFYQYKLLLLLLPPVLLIVHIYSTANIQYQTFIQDAVSIPGFMVIWHGQHCSKYTILEDREIAQDRQWQHCIGHQLLSSLFPTARYILEHIKDCTK